MQINEIFLFMIKYTKSLLYLFLFFASVINADVIKRIDISGIENISRGTVLEYLLYESGDDINSDQLQIIVNSLQKTGFFQEININFDDNILSVALKENPTIKYVEFVNFENTDILSDEVIDSLKSNFAIKIGRIYNQSLLIEMVNAIVDLYRNNGYYEFKIDTKLDQDDKNRVGIQLNISEGNQALIESLIFNGNKLFDEEDLEDFFDIGKPDFFILNYFTEKDKFNKLELDAGIEKIRNAYLDKGYLDIRVERPEFEFINGKIKIFIEIIEGIQYRLNAVEITGDKKNFSDEYLLSFFDSQIDNYFSRSTVVKTVNEINKLFLNDGYAFATTKTSFKTIKDDSLKLNLLVDIKVDSRVFINRINISGNHRTQDDVIRREIKLNEGSVYSQKEFNESIKRIKRLGYFSDVNYETRRLKDSADKVDIFLTVDETKTGEMSIGLSHSNKTGAAITAGIKQSNILGTGNTFNGSFSNSDAVEEISFYFSNPYFNSEGHNISYGAFNKKIDAENLDTSSYVLDETGLSLGYGIPIDQNTNLSFNSRISNMNLKCGTSLAIYEPSQCATNKDLDANISVTLSQNSLNDFYFPSDGMKNIISGTLGLPGSDLQYFMIEGSHRSYSPIKDDLVFKFSSRLGLAGGYGGKDLFFTKRFYEGGASSIRGFDFNSIGSKYPNGRPKGGELSFVTSAGVSSKADFLGIDNENIRLSGFIDGGTVSDRYSNFQLDDIRVSSGVEFSWLTPIGPISVFSAFPIVKKDNDATENFSFELGTTF